MFKANDYFEEAILNSNLVRIRSAFTVIAHEDPSFSTGKFQQALEYVKSKNIEGLFVEFDRRTFQPEEEWNEDYWALIVSSLVDNFCMERINHLKDISHVLYPPKAIPASKTSSNSNTYRNTNSSYSREDYGNQSKKAIPIAITAGLAVTCVAAIAVGAKWVAATAGTAAIAAGIYTILKD